MNKPVRIISNTIYGIGVAIAISLGCVALLGSNQIVNPNAMIPFTWRAQSALPAAALFAPFVRAENACVTDRYRSKFYNEPRI